MRRVPVICGLCGSLIGLAREVARDEDVRAAKRAHADCCERIQLRQHLEQGTLLAGHARARA